MVKPLFSVAALAALGTFALGCSHTTTITAKPSGAKIYVDDEYLGEGTVTTDVGNGFMGTYRVRAEHGGQKVEAEVSRDQLAWGPLGGAIGGCLGGGCVGGMSAFVVSLFAPPAFFVMPCCSVIGGGPFLVLLMWMSQGPDQIDINIEQRKVATTPEVEVQIVGGAKPSGGSDDAGGDGTGDVEDMGPIDGPSDDQPDMQPFDY